MFTLFKKRDSVEQKMSTEVTQETTSPSFIQVLGNRERSNSPSSKRNSFPTVENTEVLPQNASSKVSSQSGFNAEQYDLVDMGKGLGRPRQQSLSFLKNKPKPKEEMESTSIQSLTH